MITTIKKEDFVQKLNENETMVVKFGATWCKPCKTLEPILEQLSTQFPNICFYFVDADESPDLVAEYLIQGVPTVVLFKYGVEKSRTVGLRNIAYFTGMFNGN